MTKAERMKLAQQLRDVAKWLREDKDAEPSEAAAEMDWVAAKLEK